MGSSCEDFSKTSFLLELLKIISRIAFRFKVNLLADGPPLTMEYDQSRFEEDNASGAWRRRSILGERWWQHLRSIPATRVGALHLGSITPTSENNPHQRKTHIREIPTSEKNPQWRKTHKSEKNCCCIHLRELVAT